MSPEISKAAQRKQEEEALEALKKSRKTGFSPKGCAWMLVFLLLVWLPGAWAAGFGSHLIVSFFEAGWNAL